MATLTTSESQNTEGDILRGDWDQKDNLTFLQDAGRTEPLLKNTVVAQIVATLKLVPLTSLVLTTGASIPFGVYRGEDIPAADLVAGDVTDAAVMVKGFPVVYDVSKLIFDAGTLSIDDAIDDGTIQATTIRKKLVEIGIEAQAATEILQESPLN